MKILQIVESAYRGTIEEQDDAVIWLTHAMKGAGGEMSVLLRGNAVNYLVPGQEVSALSFGDWKQTFPPDVHGQVAGLIGKGVEVFYVEEDAKERGLDTGSFLEGAKSVSSGKLAGLLASYENVWHW